MLSWSVQKKRVADTVGGSYRYRCGQWGIIMKIMFAALLGAAALLATAASATVTVSIEAAGVQQTTQSVVDGQVATFDGVSGWVGSGNIFSGPISGTIQENGGFLVGDANLYGGAGGTGKFATVQTSTTIKLSSGVTYAGLWASSIDGDFAHSLGNTVDLYSGNSLLGSFSLKSLLSGTSSYYGNPNANFQGWNGGEPYAFYNFNSTVAFDRIDLVENGGGGFELDNLTIGNPLVADAGRDAGAVPEPASWAMMLLGFGATGAIVRGTRRRGAIA